MLEIQAESRETGSKVMISIKRLFSFFSFFPFLYKKSTHHHYIPLYFLATVEMHIEGMAKVKHYLQE